MSGRQSLYGQSLVRNANALNFSNDSPQEKHWRRDWYSPAKSVPQSTSITPSATPTPFGDERETPSLEKQNFSFKVKVWMLDNDYKPIIDGDEEDVLDLEEFSTEKKKVTNGLSEEAIRGAVGSGEGSIADSSAKRPDINEQNGYATKPEIPSIEEESLPETLATTTESKENSIEPEAPKPEETPKIEEILRGESLDTNPEGKKEETPVKPEPETIIETTESARNENPEEKKDEGEPKEDVEGDVIVE